ncbi:MAG: leucine-rich repeat domain-containing protein [Spirochaetaceae bacterium]|nr:leucine-rich repeat domain-containing protein [Spirochaetaceae bacterium]
MKNNKCIILTLAIFCLIVISANSQTQGSFGTSLGWTFSNGILTISGNGQMPDDWGSTSNRPWQSHVGSINRVVIENGVTNIGGYAFFGHSAMTSVSIGNTVTHIGNYAFAQCSRLSSVDIPASVIAIGSFAFTRSGLTNLVIPDTVRTLGPAAFENCVQLTSLHIGRGITELPNGAFRNNGLTVVTIPEGISSMGANVFSDSGNLTTIYFNAENMSGFDPAFGVLHPFSGLNALRTVIFGNNVQRIPSALFIGQSGLTSITIGNSVTQIDRYAFSGCRNLTEIVIPDSVHTIRQNAFYNNISVRSITLGSGLSEIGPQAFFNTSITTLTIPENITSIGQAAFRRSSRLQTVYFNARNAADVGGANNHFADCPVLERVVFGENVRRIPNSLFSGVASLEYVVIGSRVNAIGTNVFWRCTNLVEITNMAARPQAIQANVFDRVERSDVTLIVPADSVSAYQGANVWRDFSIRAR